MQTKAKEHGVYIVVPIYELPFAGADQNGPKFNSAVLLGRQGEIIGKPYRKHFPTTTELDEAVMPGGEVPVFDLDFGRVAILTCWDFNFPEVWQAVQAHLGYKIGLIFAT
jgi:predicted amidohydrolase